MKYCTKCGAGFDDSANFCGKCGASLNAKDESTYAGTFKPMYTEDAQKAALEKQRRISVLEAQEKIENDAANAHIYGGGIIGAAVCFVPSLIATGSFWGSVFIGMFGAVSGAFIGGMVDYFCSRKAHIQDPVRYTELLDSYADPNRGDNAILGGALFGETGAVAGAVSGKDKAVFRVTYESGRVKTETVDKGSYLYDIYIRKLK